MKNKYLIFLIFLTILNIIKCISQNNCLYNNINKGIIYDLSPFKRNSSDPWTATSKLPYGGDNLYKFNFCNVTVDQCHGSPDESPLNIYSSACQSNYYQVGSVLEPESVEFPDNGLTIITSSYHIDPTSDNACMGSPVPNRRRMKFFLICNLNMRLLTSKTEVLEVETCTYQIEYYSSLVCDCNYGCSNHGGCYGSGHCLCDSKTNGSQCETSRVIIKQVYYHRHLHEDNIDIFGYFGFISPMLTTVKIGNTYDCLNGKQHSPLYISCTPTTLFYGEQVISYTDGDLSSNFSKNLGTYRIEFLTTIKNIKLSLTGFFGTISNESIINIGELQCNNLKQINDSNIVCQVDKLQFGENNVTITDNDLSYTILKDFGNCTSHVKYEVNSCLCDSKTKGVHCEISKIYIGSVKSPTIDGGLTYIYGFFSIISENSIIDIGSNQCINIIQYNETTIQCEIIAGVGIHDVTLNDGDITFTLLKGFQYTPLLLSKCFKDDKPCGGISQGVCTNNGCVCKSPWVGTDCSSKVIIIPQPSKNDSNPTIEFEINDEQTNKYNNNNNTLFKSIISIVKLRELDFNSKEINSFNFSKWEFKEIDNTTYKYKSNISTTDVTITLQWFEKETNISFAYSDIKMKPSTIKYTIEISKYNFKNKLNRLQLIISTMMVMNNTSDDGNNNNKNNNNNKICSNKEFGETIKEENSNYLKIQIDNHSIYARFIKRAIVDTTKIITLENSMLDSSRLSDINIDGSGSKSDNVSYREAFIGITIPYFQNQIIIDPDFTMLMDTKEISSLSSSYSNNNESGMSASKIAAIIICSILFVVVIVAGSTYIWFKKKSDENLIKTIQMKMQSGSFN
ncbi:hypothetical protein ACTFIR_003047 [Dictyostelium discoideum]